MGRARRGQERQGGDRKQGNNWEKDEKKALNLFNLYLFGLIAT